MCMYFASMIHLNACDDKSFFIGLKKSFQRFNGVSHESYFLCFCGIIRGNWKASSVKLNWRTSTANTYKAGNMIRTCIV
ncbi:hypothetical protein Hanom_Chr03g00221151 [Helianthus anomalus]